PTRIETSHDFDERFSITNEGQE
ncbi:unnamed protein product, partial [Allacma fusca]